MLKIFRNSAIVPLPTLLFFAFLEVVFRFIGAPGSSDFIEGVIIRENLSPHKPADEIRIFTYGESTMHGSHYGAASNPARWLSAYLQDFLPDKKIRVVNFARMGQGSRFMLKAFQETLNYQPDYIFFYYGHNTLFPANRKKEVLEKEASFSSQFKKLIRQSYFISTVLRQTALKRKFKNRMQDSLEYVEVEVRPQTPEPEHIVWKDSDVYKENAQFSKENTLAILELAKKHRIPAIFMMPVGNLKDFSPQLSKHFTALSPQQLQDWQRLYRQGKTAEKNKKDEEALNFYRQAYALDATYAMLSFRMGKLLFRKGELEEARHLFVEACDHDGVIRRATTDIQNGYRELAAAGKINLIDTEKILAPEAPGGILGEPIIEDNVHFFLKGHSLAGLAMAREMARLNWIAP